MNSLATTNSALSALIPLDDNVNMPATTSAADNEFLTGRKSGFPVLSIKGSKFAIKRNGEREVIKQNGHSVTAIGIIVLRSTPGLSKNYYKDRYVEGSTERPDCYSNDGVKPAPDAKTPQHSNCAACPHNQWGSRITDDGRKALACADSKRLAVAAYGALDDPMLLSIPATSLKNWDAYVKSLTRRGRTPVEVVTEIAFDDDAEYPRLMFKALGALPEEARYDVMEARESPEVASIIEATLTEANDLDDYGAEVPVAKEEPAPKAPSGTKPTAKAEPESEAEPAPKKATRRKSAPKADQSLEAVTAEAEAQPQASIAVEDGDDLLNELGNALDGFDDDFDD